MATISKVAKAATTKITRGNLNHNASSEEAKPKGKINTNVILTEFEKSLLEELAYTDPETGLVYEVTKDDIYGMNIINDQKVDDEWNIVTRKIKFLSMKWNFKTETWIKNVSIVVTNDDDYYVQLQKPNTTSADEKSKKFVSNIENMQYVLAHMQQGLDVETERNEILAF